MKQKKAILYLLIILIFLIGSGILISKSIKIQNPLSYFKFQNDGSCTYKNSKFKFKFSYDCNNLSRTHVWDVSGCYTAETCGSLNYNNGNYISQVNIDVSDIGNAPLCYEEHSIEEPNIAKDTMSCFGISNGVFVNKRDIKYSLSSYNEPYTREEAALVEKYKNVVHEEIVPETAIKNNNGVLFYKLPAMSDWRESFCAVIPKLKDPRWVCLKSDKGFDDNMKEILNNFSFY